MRLYSACAEKLMRWKTKSKQRFGPMQLQLLGWRPLHEAVMECGDGVLNNRHIEKQEAQAVKGSALVPLSSAKSEATQRETVLSQRSMGSQITASSLL